MITFDDALGRVIDIAKPLGVEAAPIARAHGRVLARPVIARFSMPRTDVSAMDGYAVRDADLSAMPVSLRIAGEAYAGTPPGQLLPQGTAFRIFTGAPVPSGATRVIIQEDVERREDVVHIQQPVGAGRNIRTAGSDFREDDSLVAAGTELNWRALTVAAAADRAELDLFRRPRIGIMATGDELSMPGEALQRPGAIPESVSPGIAAFVRSHGGDVIRSRLLPDDPAILAPEAAAALADADVVIVIGGASVGDKDYSRRIFGAALDYVFPKVAIKPGKPVWLARMGERFILGLPGNPTSALVTARLFLAPLLAGLAGGNAAGAVRFCHGVCADPLAATGDRETFLRARRSAVGLRLADSQDSGSQRSLATSDALIRRRAGAASTAAGAEVEFLDF